MKNEGLNASEIRRRNLIREVARLNPPTLERLAELTESPAGYYSQVKHEHRNMGDAVARRIEKALELPYGYMDVLHDSNLSEPSDEVRPALSSSPPTADAVLHRAIEALADRATQRDAPTGERSMARAVAAFNALYGRDLSETEGWMFMAILKAARASQGDFRADDYIDMAAYAALAGEAAGKAQ